MLPMYTITGFDASAHTSEETVGAAHHVPRAIVRSVLVSGVFGWMMLAAIVVAIPNMNEAAAQGDNVFYWTMGSVLPGWMGLVLCVGIVVAQYLCGLATVTSASRMTYAFARDGGLPWSRGLCRVSPRFGSPAIAIWVRRCWRSPSRSYTPVYTTIDECVHDLALPLVRLSDAAGPDRLRTHLDGDGTVEPGPLVPPSGGDLLARLWVSARHWRPAAERESRWIVLGSCGVTVVIWFGVMRHRFQGPPPTLLGVHRRTAAKAVEAVAAGSVPDE